MPTRPGQRFAGKHDNLPAKIIDEEDKVPTEFISSPEKMDTWTFLKTDLQSRGLWSSTYEMEIKDFVHAVHRLQQIRKQLDEDGILVEKLSQKGNPIGKMKHPLLDAEKDWALLVKRYMADFGMNPKDIVFLYQTDPTSLEVIEAVVEGKDKIVYFRD